MFKSLRMRWEGHDRSICWGLVENHGGKGSLEIPNCWWEKYFKIYFNQIELKGVDLICLANNRNTWAAVGEYNNKPFGSIKILGISELSKLLSSLEGQ
jgi:hypothetical protein